MMLSATRVIKRVFLTSLVTGQQRLNTSSLLISQHCGTRININTHAARNSCCQLTRHTRRSYACRPEFISYELVPELRVTDLVTVGEID